MTDLLQRDLPQTLSPERKYALERMARMDMPSREILQLELEMAWLNGKGVGLVEMKEIFASHFNSPIERNLRGESEVSA